MPYYQQDSERLQDGGPEPPVRWFCTYCETVVETPKGEGECPNCGVYVKLGEALPVCEHGVPHGRGCDECEQWEAADYHRDRMRDFLFSDYNILR